MASRPRRGRLVGTSGAGARNAWPPQAALSRRAGAAAGAPPPSKHRFRHRRRFRRRHRRRHCRRRRRRH
eukprot:scaffold39182_cov48-Phaeocystis_antarctica.AAC.1